MATAAKEIADVDEAEAPAAAPIEPSELDETVHAEALLLYRDAEDNIRFAKGLQWKAVGGTIALFALLVAACHLVDRQVFFIKLCVFFSVVLSVGSIYAISILQSWQNTEREKVDTLIRHLSTLTGRVYGVKSRVEANIHRYILIAFMAITIAAANYVAASVLMRLYQS